MQGIAALSLLLLVFSVNAAEWDSPIKNTTLIVAGRSGSGISSTVREIIGLSNETPRENVLPTPIKEIQVPTPGGSFLKIVDVEGLVDGKSFEHDARVMAYLQSYLSEPTGLNGTLPEFFLIISNFDDGRHEGSHSIFTEVLKRVGMVQQAVYNDTTPNTLFLLTRLMSSTKSTQRKPQSKIQDFLGTILEFSPFKGPITLVVGENLREENELNVENGYTKLPNRQLYPKNLFDELIETAVRLGDNGTADVVKKLRDTREDSEVVEVDSEYFKVVDPTIIFERNEAQFLNKLYGLTSDPTDSEINIAIQNASEQLVGVSKSHVAAAVTELQRYFKSTNLTKSSQLPTTALEKVRFFQNLPQINSFQLLIVKTAFDLSMPNYFLNPVVGYGFDVIQDYPLDTTPFIRHPFKASPVGYQMPDFLTCSKILDTKQADFNFVSNTLADYISLRYKFLGFLNGEGPAVSAFKDVGRIKSGFNLVPEMSEVHMSLSAIREVRTIKCELNNVYNFTAEFLEDLEALSPFDNSNRDSMKSWLEFFGKFGTHVVSQGFGGGYMHSSIIGVKIRNSSATLNETLNEVLNLRNILVGQKPNYAFFGGDKNSVPENIYDLDPAVRESAVQNWRDSLVYDPLMLNYELTLTPIATYVKRVNQELGLEVERAASLLLSGNLTYKRKFRLPRNNSSSSVALPPASSSVIVQNNSNQNPYSSPEKTVHNTSQKIESPLGSKFDSNSPNPDTEYTFNTLGQGYHMLKDTVLPISPFPAKRLHERNFYQDKRPQRKYLHATRFRTMFDYLENRLMHTFLVTRVPKNVTQNFKGRVPPGSIIEDRIEGNQIDIETRDFKEWINVKHVNDISYKFNQSVQGLPIFTNYVDLDCKGREKWKDFFDTFGTHYVESTFYGFSYAIPLNASGLSGLTGFSECQTAATYGTQNYTTGSPRVTKIQLVKLRTSYEFVSYSRVFDDIWGLTPSLKVSEAMYQLMDNNLSC